MSELTHPYMFTASGKKWMVKDLQPDMIDIQSIANGLAKECRFGGQIEGFYSVARHSLIMREALKDKLPRPLWIYPLMHDAAEAYMRDMCKPVKVCLPDYAAMEDEVMSVIAAKYGLMYPFPDIIKEYDSRIVMDEANTLFSTQPEWIKDFYNAGMRPLGVEIKTHPWQTDLREFQKAFHDDIKEYRAAADAIKFGWVEFP